GDIIDENGSVISENEVIPAGSSFTLYRTDGKNNDGDEAIVDAILSDGRIVRLKVTIGYPNTINGVDEFELFEMLYYAG
ncbi:MAG: hypothetical protein K6A69_03025, partial [Lachnospiraceae bacterium]|nr:hypothetical protein [Lachnospiraceae bacterium]